MGENIKDVKRTKTGDVLMTVEHKAKQKTDDIIISIEDALGNYISIIQQGNSRLIQIINLVKITCKEEVIDAIQEMLGMATKDTRIIVSDLQVWKDGTHAANILIPEPEAAKLLKKGRIKVGWSSCPIRQKEKPIRCYKSHGFDHHKNDCHGDDNSKCCWKCGSESHQVKECDIDGMPKCHHCTRSR